MGTLARAVFGMKGPKKNDGAKATKKRAYEIQTVNDIPYFKDLLKQLDEIAQQPVTVGNHAIMIEQVGKQNAYREFLGILRKDLETAERMIGMDQARQRGS